MRRFLEIKALALAALLVVAVLSVLPSIAAIVPGGMPLPAWITSTFTSKFQLGLDLQGGLHLEYSVAVDEAVQKKLDQVATELEAGFRSKKGVEAKVTREGHDTLRIAFDDPADVATATPDVLGVALDLLERVEPESGPGEADGVITLRVPAKTLEGLRKGAVETAVETVRSRVDAMGVGEPNIYPKNRQIVVELPGSTEAAGEAAPEDTGDLRRLLGVIERQAVLSMHLVEDEAPFRDTGKPYLQAVHEAGLVTQGMGIAVNRLPSYGKEHGATVEEPYAFYAKDRSTLEDFFEGLPPEWRLPAELQVAYGPVSLQTHRTAEPEVVWRTYVIASRAAVSGEHVFSASVQPDPQTQVPQVGVRLNRIGASLMEELSGANVGRRMAIVLDDAVRSAPVFDERIGKSFVITLGATPGQSVREAANDLSKVLESGSLPARLDKELQIRVSADLGADSVRHGAQAFALGLGAVILFMLGYYRKSGLIAVFALVLNMVFILTAMASFGALGLGEATLTLPGIAGIVLTIGMAVDANVIIFERIRDYLREGHSPRAAIEAGYERALTTILDAQLTTAIAGIVLYQYGSGPIRGFAVTLLVGIATSIFTGVFCTRLLFDFQTNRRGFDRVSI